MPRQDGTGPFGQGPNTGRGMGLCQGAGHRGFQRGCGHRRGVGFWGQRSQGGDSFDISYQDLNLKIDSIGHELNALKDLLLKNNTKE